MKEEEIPKLEEEATKYHKQYQEEILQVQGELQLQQKTSEDVIESEAKAQADIKVCSRSLLQSADLLVGVCRVCRQSWTIILLG